MVHDQLDKTITLSAEYVSKTVQLGYATTVHGAQGITTGTCHVVLTGDEDRNLLYVALSRGKFANHLYLSVASDGDPHNLIRPEALVPPTALDRIAQMLRRDGSPVSATTTLRGADQPAPAAWGHGRALPRRRHRWRRESHRPARHGQDRRARRSTPDRADRDTCVADTALPPRAHRARRHSPLKLLTAAVGVGSLADARDPAAVLDARIDDLVAELIRSRHTMLTLPPAHQRAAAVAARHPRPAG